MLRRISVAGVGMRASGICEWEVNACRKKSTVYWPSLQEAASAKVRELEPSVRAGQSINPATWSDMNRSCGRE